MANGFIKKESESINGKTYYKVMIKADSFFSSWYEEFGSFNKKETDSMFNEIKQAANITIYED